MNVNIDIDSKNTIKSLESSISKNESIKLGINKKSENNSYYNIFCCNSCSYLHIEEKCGFIYFRNYVDNRNVSPVTIYKSVYCREHPTLLINSNHSPAEYYKICKQLVAKFNKLTIENKAFEFLNVLILFDQYKTTKKIKNGRKAIRGKILEFINEPLTKNYMLNNIKIINNCFQ